MGWSHTSWGTRAEAERDLPSCHFPTVTASPWQPLLLTRALLWAHALSSAPLRHAAHPMKPTTAPLLHCCLPACSCLPDSSPYPSVSLSLLPILLPIRPSIHPPPPLHYHLSLLHFIPSPSPLPSSPPPPPPHTAPLGISVTFITYSPRPHHPLSSHPALALGTDRPRTRSLRPFLNPQLAPSGLCTNAHSPRSQPTLHKPPHASSVAFERVASHHLAGPPPILVLTRSDPHAPIFTTAPDGNPPSTSTSTQQRQREASVFLGTPTKVPITGPDSPLYATRRRCLCRRSLRRYRTITRA